MQIIGAFYHRIAFSPFSPLETISTSSWASLHHHFPVLSVFSHVSCQFVFSHVFSVVVCPSIIELHDLHKSFVSSIVVFYGSTALRMRAQYSHMSHWYDDGQYTVFGSWDTRGSQRNRPRYRRARPPPPSTGTTRTDRLNVATTAELATDLTYLHGQQRS